MSFQAWKGLSAEDRWNWDKISEKGKKTILDEGRNKKSSSTKVERWSINKHDFFFNVLEDDDTTLSIIHLLRMITQPTSCYLKNSK
jgi:hypothetical protein